MSKPVSIRPAIESDIPWIVNELKSFSNFFNSKIPLFPGEDYTYVVMQSHIESHVLLVAESEAGLMGFISGMLHPHLFNQAINVLTETFWWVPEIHRGTRAGLLLLNEYTRIGKEKADWLIFTLEDHSPVNDRCLTRRGYKIKEHCYILEKN